MICLKSTSIAIVSSTLVITVPFQGILENKERFCLVLAQSLPSSTSKLPVFIQFSGTKNQIPLLTRLGNTLYLSQLDEWDRLPIIYGSDPSHFLVSSCMPYTLRADTTLTPSTPTTPPTEEEEEEDNGNNGNNGNGNGNNGC